MGSKLYVGNLSYETTSSDLQTLFEQHGTVSSAEVIQDRETGRSKGFGFVQMGTDEEAQKAISALSGQDHGGRALTVNEAKPREDRPRGGGGGGYGGNRSGGGRGGYGNSSGGNNAPASRGYVERGNTGGRSASRDNDRSY
jgi:RNA recognition motif-containing protein